MKLNLIERIKQLTLDIWRTSRNSAEILKEVSHANERLDEIEKNVVDRLEYLYFRLIEKESKDE